MKSYPLILSALTFCFPFVGCSSAQGGEGEECYANGTCDEALTCLSNKCVSLDDGSGGTTGGGDSAYDWSACFDCGDTECADQAETCGADCRAALECMLECAPADTACVQECDPGTLTQEEGLAMVEYFSCATTSCYDECVDVDFDTGTGGGTGDGTGGGGTGDGTGGGTNDGTGGSSAMCSDGNFSGNCYDNNYLVCADGAMVDGACEGCGIVTPDFACGYFSMFAISDIDFKDLSGVAGEMTQTPTAVSADFSFTGAYQRGVISMHFPEPYYVGDFSVSASSNFTGATLDVTLEGSGGAYGCTFTLGGTVVADGCWGGATEASAFDVMNIAVHSASSGSGTLTVSDITFAT